MGDRRGRAAARAAGFVAAIFLADCLSAQSISNGTFEDGLPPGTPPAQWDTTGDFYHWTNPGKAHSGSEYAYFGIASDGMTPPTNSSGSIEQTINLPADAASASGYGLPPINPPVKPTTTFSSKCSAVRVPYSLRWPISQTQTRSPPLRQ